MKHHLLLYDPETRLWSRPDLLPGHVFGQPEHAVAFGHTDTASMNPESGIWFRVSVDPGGWSARVESSDGPPTSLMTPLRPDTLVRLVSDHLELEVAPPLTADDIRAIFTHETP